MAYTKLLAAGLAALGIAAAGAAAAKGSADRTAGFTRPWVGVAYPTGSYFAYDQARRMERFRVFPRDPRCEPLSPYLYRGSLYCLRPR